MADDNQTEEKKPPQDKGDAEPQSQGGSGSGGYYADGSSKESGDTDEQGRMKKVAMPGQSSDKQQAREFKKSKRSGGVLQKLGSGKIGRYGKAAMLTAGMMAPGGPSGMSAFKGQEGMNDQANNIHKEQRISEEQIAANRKSPEFEPYDNQQIKTVDSAGNISTGQSQGSGGYYADGSSKESGATDEQGRMKKVALQGGSSSVSENDQASIRRGLNQNKLQDRNIRDGTEKKGDTKQGDQVKEDKTLKSRWQKIQNERKNIKANKAKIAGKIDAEGQGMAAASQAANKAIAQAYNQIFSIIEETELSFFYLIFIFGPIYFFLLFGRGVLSMIGMMKIKIKGVEVNLVPGFSFNEFFLRFFGFSVIFGIFVIEWFAIWILYEQVMNPWGFWWEVTKGTVGTALDWF